MPKDIFNSEVSSELGIIPRTHQVYLVLCQSLGVPEGNFPIWANIDDAIIKRRAESLGLETNGPIERVLAKIEERYLIQSARVYQTSPDWNSVATAYKIQKSHLVADES